MDLILYNKFNKVNNDIENYSDNLKNGNDVKNKFIDLFVISFELFGLLIGFYILLNCKKNLVINILIFIFSPWLFIILSCFGGWCGGNSNKCFI